MPATTPARRVGLVASLPALLSLAACDDGRTTTGGDGLEGSRRDTLMSPEVPPEWTAEWTGGEPAAGAVPLDFGDDWEAVARQLRGDGNDPTPLPSGDAGVGTDGQTGRETWGIILETFVGDESREPADRMLGDLPRIDPQLGAAWVHTTKKGSMVVYGRYPGPQDPSARQDLAWLKQLKFGGRTVFGRLMMGNVTDQSRRQWRVVDLMSVRQRYPDVNPLYTLQVAVWGSFQGAFPWEDAQRRAEGYATRLRTQGHMAFVHHDSGKELAMVTVGLFDRGALDPESGLFRADVEALLKQFPEHLINGEPLHVASDGRDPSRGTRSQKPMLVLVPELD